ncbi:MAG: hypothetical protein ABIE94_06670 [archaeon]
MKQLLFIPLVLWLLFMTGCDGGDTYNTDFYVGSDGLVMEYYLEAPPETVYEKTDFPVKVTVSNKGATDVRKDDSSSEDNRGLLMLTYDPTYLKPIGNWVTPGTLIINDPHGQPIINLHGKSIYWPLGNEMLYDVVEFTVKELPGKISAPTTDVLATACYPYKTLYSKVICLDMNIYSRDVRSQACLGEEEYRSSNQGAPIAVKSVQPIFLPVDEAHMKPRFNILIENVGDGYVLDLNKIMDPDKFGNFPNLKPWEELRERCTGQAVQPKSDSYQEKHMKINAWITADKIPLECMPLDIRLIQNEVSIMCQTVGDIPIRPNYMTPLTIELEYIYTHSVSQTIQIYRQ